MADPLWSYFQGVLQEFKKVVWPTRAEIIQHTLVVIGLSLALALFLGGIDYLLNIGLEKLLLNR